MGDAPQRFRKKPVVIEAMQFRMNADGRGTNASDISLWLGPGHLYYPNGIPSGPLHDRDRDKRPTLVIATREGDHVALPGDWIIKGVQGEFYPCKPDIFAATHEPADELVR